MWLMSLGRYTKNSSEDRKEYWFPDSSFTCHIHKWHLKSLMKKQNRNDAVALKSKYGSKLLALKISSKWSRMMTINTLVENLQN